MATHLSQGPGLMVSGQGDSQDSVLGLLGDISPRTWAKTTWVYEAEHCQVEHQNVTSKSRLEQQDRVENSLELPVFFLRPVK